jgi:hypothetical protein
MLIIVLMINAIMLGVMMISIYNRSDFTNGRLQEFVIDKPQKTVFYRRAA